MEINRILVISISFVVMTFFTCVYSYYDAVKASRKAEEAEKRRVKSGYYWYEDDTLSNKKRHHKGVFFYWSGREDSNLRLLAPHASALPD